jgi:O-methyltransferase
MSLSSDEVFEALPQIRGALLEGIPAHSVVIPFASYSPWLIDEPFQAVFGAVFDHTLLDTYRLYELWQLVRQLGPGDLLEVGVWRGGSGALMAAAAPDKTVFLCDTFNGVVNASDQDSTYRGGEHADTSTQIVSQLVDRLGLTNVKILRGIFPQQTAHIIDDLTFALCHIDVDVYESARRTIDWVWPRLAVGGVVVYDDYGYWQCSGITTLVNERLGLPGSVTIHNLNGHAVVVKTA